MILDTSFQSPVLDKDIIRVFTITRMQDTLRYKEKQNTRNRMGVSDGKENLQPATGNLQSVSCTLQPKTCPLRILFLVFFVVSAVWCNAAVADSTLLRTKKDSTF